MNKKHLYKKYKDVALRYLENQEEAKLYKVSLLSRQFIKAELGPDEVIQLHFDALREILESHDSTKHREIVLKMSTLLLEAIMVYSDTHKKVRDVLAELEKRYKELDETNRELRETQAQLIQSEKLAAVGELASGIAHEINNPLTAITMNTAFLLESIKDDDRKLRQLRTIERESDRASKIVKQLLTFSRRKKMEEREWAGVNEIIEDTLKPIEHQLILDDIRIVREFTRDLPKIKINPVQLQQVFLNLINNSRDAINLHRNKPTNLIVICTSQVSADRKYIKVGIKDNGCGIPRDKINRIFDPFYTTKSSEKGTGLGLSVSYQIIKAHDGDIQVESEFGKGTVFVVKIPV